MAGGFPLSVNGIDIRTSEALYQACRFPHLPEIQRLIIDQKSPMTAKMKGKPHRNNSRSDWNQVRVQIMRWCLRVKLAQNRHTFSELLLETGERAIVEQSRKDDFWGAKQMGRDTLVGINVLGRLLMELREEIQAEGLESLLIVPPLDIPNFLIDKSPIEVVSAGETATEEAMGQSFPKSFPEPASQLATMQLDFLDQPAVKETRPQEYPATKETEMCTLDPQNPTPRRSTLAGSGWRKKLRGCWGRLFAGSR